MCLVLSLFCTHEIRRNKTGSDLISFRKTQQTYLVLVSLPQVYIYSSLFALHPIKTQSAKSLLDSPLNPPQHQWIHSSTRHYGDQQNHPSRATRNAPRTKSPRSVPNSATKHRTSSHTPTTQPTGPGARARFTGCATPNSRSETRTKHPCCAAPTSNDWKRARARGGG